MVYDYSVIIVTDLEKDQVEDISKIFPFFSNRVIISFRIFLIT